MKIVSRAYNSDEDLTSVLTFLYEIFRRTASYQNWFPDRFENSHRSSGRTRWVDDIRIWDAINLLSGLDPYLMGYKDRARYLASKNYDYVFDRSGNATSGILLNGQVIGVWDLDETIAKIFLFNDVEKNVLKEIRSNAASVGSFVLNKETTVKECDTMIPLSRRTAGGVMSPLRGC